MSYGSSHDLDGIQNSEADHYNSGIYGQASENNIDQDKLKNPKTSKTICKRNANVLNNKVQTN